MMKQRIGKMLRKQALSFPRITSDFAGVLCQLSRMASCSIRRESSQIKHLDSRLRGNDNLSNIALIKTALSQPFDKLRTNGKRHHHLNQRFLRGFTLIELLVALVVLVLIAIAGYSGLNTVLHTRDRIAQETRKWQHLSYFFSRLEQDLAQVVSRPVRGTDGFSQAEWLGRTVALEHEAHLTFTRSSMADAALAAPQRIGYRLQNNTISLFRWPFPDQAPNTLPIIYPLLEGVQDFRLRHLDGNRIWHEQWLPAPSTVDKIPAALEVQLTLVSGEKITRVFALQ